MKKTLKEIAKMFDKVVKKCIYCGKPFIAWNEQHKVCPCEVCQRKRNTEKQKRHREKIKAEAEK